MQGGGLVVCVGAAVSVVGFGLGRGRAEVVASDSGDDDEQDCGAVEDDCLEPGASGSGFGGFHCVCVFGLGVHGGGG